MSISILLLCYASICSAQSTNGISTGDPASARGIPDLPESLRDATAELDRLGAEAEKNADLRTRAVLAWRNPVVSFPEGTADLAALTKLGVPDDPATLMLFATGCDAFEVGCDALPFAVHWTEVDGQNAAAWLELWNVDTRLGDTVGGDAALVRAVAAPNWNDYTVELTRAFVATADPSRRSWFIWWRGCSLQHGLWASSAPSTVRPYRCAACPAKKNNAQR